MVVTVDATILAAFGEPPEGMDLEEQRVVAHNVAVCVSLGLAVASVALRLYVRRMKGARLGMDDYTIVASTFFSGTTVALTILSGRYGAGEHIWASNLPRLMTFLKIIYSEPYMYGLAVTFTKISVLLLYRRLLYSKASPRSLFSILYWLAFSLSTVYPVILWVTMACACQPVSYYWNQYIGAEGHCINIKLFFLVLGIMNMLNDIVILIVPIPKIMQLQLSKRLKASIIGIMLLGGFVCVASTVRIYYLNGLFQNTDATWWMGPTMAWSSIEPSVAIISACLPTFAPLFRLRRSKRSTESPYYVSNSRSKMGNTVTSSIRNAGRLGISSPGRTNATHFILEDDEVELTCKVVGGDSTSSHRSEGKRSSDDDQGIMVTRGVRILEYESRCGFPPSDTICDRQSNLTLLAQDKRQSLDATIRCISGTLRVRNFMYEEARALRIIATATARRASRLAGVAIAAILIQTGKLNATNIVSPSVFLRKPKTTDAEGEINKPARVDVMSRVRHFVDRQFCKILPRLGSRLSNSPTSKSALGSDLTVSELLEVTADIGVDSSLFEFYPTFEEDVRGTLRDIPEVGAQGEKRITLGIAKDGSSVGAALVAQSVP
ncbi:hypothetical protein AK830_g4328 [Neonectria ditissima]|uniref:Uncharacterized protein n=1 Tax=Neonectria ditissima TaxID=78410 RepID=A0A0P7BP11_9HYPO|nr:hypothetical protein AK830_g4328 [Neonectria ditissima]